MFCSLSNLYSVTLYLLLVSKNQSCLSRKKNKMDKEVKRGHCKCSSKEQFMKIENLKWDIECNKTWFDSIWVNCLLWRYFNLLKRNQNKNKFSSKNGRVQKVEIIKCSSWWHHKSSKDNLVDDDKITKLGSFDYDMNGNAGINSEYTICGNRTVLELFCCTHFSYNG